MVKNSPDKAISITGHMMFAWFLFSKLFGFMWGNFFGRLQMRLWGGMYGSGLRCFGIPRIIIQPGGKLRIGQNCILRSQPCSNVAGITHPVQFFVGRNGTLELGEHSGISGSFITAYKYISIGKRVNIGVGCVISDTDFHPIDAALRTQGVGGKCAPIVIADDVWLGMNVTVLKGVTIGQSCVIGAGSVVTSDIPAGWLAAGVPARPVRKIISDLN